MFFGRRGDAGFIGPLLWVCSGVVGFNVAMFLRPVRDTFRPARPDVGASAKKFAPQAQNGQNMLFSGALGEFFRGNAAEGIPPGSFFADQQSWDPTGQVVLRRSSGSRARLLAVLTLQCAAKPYWWHGGQPAQATTYRVNVRIIGPACAGRGPGHHLSG